MNIVLFLAVGLVIFHSGDALKCYTCINCGDPFNSSDALALTCLSNQKVCIKSVSVFGGKDAAVIRTCSASASSPDGAKEEFASSPVVSSSVYECDTDLCNAASSTVALTTLIFSAFLFLIFSGR